MENKKLYPVYYDDVQFVDTKDMMAKFKRQQRADKLLEAVENLEKAAKEYEDRDLEDTEIKISIQANQKIKGDVTGMMEFIHWDDSICDALIKLSEGLGGK
jgi:hypothetical protein